MRNDVRFRILTATAALAVGLGLAGVRTCGRRSRSHADQAPRGIPPRASPQGARRGSSRRVQAPGGDLRGEPLLRQPLRHLGRGPRPARGRPRRRDHGQAHRRSPRTASTYSCLPAERRQPRVADRCPNTCQDAAHAITASHFGNDVFDIDDYIAPDRPDLPGSRGPLPPTACSRTREAPSPAAAPGTSCTASTRSSTRSTAASRTATRPGSDAVGLTQGVYETQQLPIYRYLHSKGAPKYVIADRFFQGAFGGSFLNHQWLIAARAPLDTDRRRRTRTLDRPRATRCSTPTGWPTRPTRSTPRPGRCVDGELTQSVPGRRQRRGGRVRRLRGQHGAAGQRAPKRDRSPDPADRRHGVPEHR